MKIYDLEDYDSYYDEPEKHNKSFKKKVKRKGHQSKHQGGSRWDLFDSYEEEGNSYVEPSSYQKPKPVTNTYVPHDVPHDVPHGEGAKQFVPGPNTHTIKGNIIDFDRVANIEKVEGLYNGVTTYGIKFLFMGKKGSFRIAWFNTNIRERDAIYNNEYAFWSGLKK